MLFYNKYILEHNGHIQQINFSPYVLIQQVYFCILCFIFLYCVFKQYINFNVFLYSRYSNVLSCVTGVLVCAHTTDVCTHVYTLIHSYNRFLCMFLYSRFLYMISYNIFLCMILYSSFLFMVQYNRMMCVVMQ